MALANTLQRVMTLIRVKALHLFSTALVLLTLSPVSAASDPRIVIILDDLGYRQTDTAALSLPQGVTFSVLPFTPLGRSLADKASAQGRDIMLHMPMESLGADNLGPAALTSAMLPQDISATLKRSLDSLPQAIGVNNHMGSKLTEQPLAMQSVMQVVKERGLFFVDSRTTAQSVAEGVAKKMGVPALRRHIFLDHQPTTAFMKIQFARLVHRAHQHGVAVAIAHPYPQTLAFLNDALAQEFDVRLVPVSDVLPAINEKIPDTQVADALLSAPE